MGCTSSTAIIVEDRSSSYIPQAEWARKMTRFVKRHVKQMDSYSYDELEIMCDTFKRFSRGAGAHNRNLSDPVHSKAIEVLDTVFKVDFDTDSIHNDLIKQIPLYSASKTQQAEFNEVAFVFSIIVNAPALKKYETKY
jgi:hypothetical protein